MQFLGQLSDFRPASIRKTYHALTILVGLLVVGLVFYFFFASVNTNELITSELEKLHKKQTLIEKISRIRLEISGDIDLYLQDPGTEFLDEITFQLVSDSIESNVELLTLIPARNSGLIKTVESLIKNLKNLRIKVSGLFRPQQDFKQQSPGLTAATPETIDPVTIPGKYLEILTDEIMSDVSAIEAALVRQERELLSQIQNNANRDFILLAAVVSLFLILISVILVSLDRTVFKPVQLVSEALKSRPFNRQAPQIKTGKYREISALVEAFQEMDEKANRRQNEVDSLFAWQLAILDSAEYGIISTDTKGVIATFNRTSELLLGYKPEEVIGKVSPAIIHDPEEVQEYAAVLSEELGQKIEPGFEVFVAKARLGLIDEREWRYVCKDGSKISVYLSVTAIRGADQEIIGFLGTFFDLSERKATQANLRESEKRYQTLFNSASDAIFLLGDDAGIIECNPATLTMLGCTRQQIVESTIENFSPEYQLDGRLSRTKARGKISAALKGKNQSFEWRYTRFDGTPLDAEVSLNAVTIENVPYVLGTVRDITEHKQLLEQLSYQAGHDSLTGLPNRKTLHEAFVEYRQVADGSGKHIAMLLLDLNRFKEINDTLGHHLGDRLLVQVGPRLKQACLNETTTIARLGGDEFAILVESDKSAEDICLLANQFLLQLRDPFEVGGIKTSIGASIGVAVYPQHGQDSHELLRAADVAMYDAKKRSLGIKLYSPEIDDYSKQRLKFATELAQASKERQLVLHYQPKIDISTGEVAGFEALVRWQHPELGLLFPHSFIDIVEMSEVIHSFTRTVIGLAVSDKKSLNLLGYKQPVAINLSARNLLDDSCFKTLEAALASHNLSTTEVELELTESSVMHDPERAITMLNRYKRRGINIAIDDFGTGYSSLAYLRQLPVNALKIDRTFVKHMLTDTQNSAIVRSTIALAHSLDLKVVAEGVEDEKVLSLLDSMDCDQAQGFGICRPQSIQKLTKWLSAREQKLRIVRA